MDIDTLRHQLHQGVVEVSFTKVNGDTRVMNCTLNMGLVPPSAWPEDKGLQEKESKTQQIRVYDVVAGGWRSFIFSNVFGVKQL